MLIKTLFFATTTFYESFVKKSMTMGRGPNVVENSVMSLMDDPLLLLPKAVSNSEINSVHVVY